MEAVRNLTLAFILLMITEELLKLRIQNLVWKYAINIRTHYARNVFKINIISNKETLRISEITDYEKRSYALCVCDIKVKVSHDRPRWPKGFRVG
jgi:hypothetical protein